MAGIGLAGLHFLRNPVLPVDDNKVSLEYAVAKLTGGTRETIPFWRIESGRDGPSLGMIAAQHGNEVQGAEIALRFKNICAKDLVSGSVWLVPMANTLAVRSRKSSFSPEGNNVLDPEKVYDMQTHWPGDPEGNDTARMAYAIDQAVLKNCSHLVDIHNCSHFRGSEAITEEKHEGSRMMGEAAATRFISYTTSVIPQKSPMMVSQLMLGRGRNVLVIELPGQFRMNERSIQSGLDSMVNIARLLGMMRGNPDTVEPRAVTSNPETSHIIKAPFNGIFMRAVRSKDRNMLIPEDFVDEGQIIGHIIREDNLETVNIIAPVAGYLAQLGACHDGLCNTSLPAQHPYTLRDEIIVRIVTV